MSLVIVNNNSWLPLLKDQSQLPLMLASYNHTVVESSGLVVELPWTMEFCLLGMLMMHKEVTGSSRILGELTGEKVDSSDLDKMEMV